MTPLSLLKELLAVRFVLYIFSVLLFFSLSVMGCGGESTTPETLSGTWTTVNDRYQDRYIEFTDDAVVFGTGTGTPDFYFITDIKMDSTDQWKIIKVSCRNYEETEFDFEFQIEEIGGMLTMRLKNPNQVVWTKKQKIDIPAPTTP